MKSFRICLILIAAAAVGLPRALAVEMQGIVTGDRVIIRSKPGQPYERLGTFQKGEVVTVVKEENGWYAVLLPPSVCGWITQDNLDENNAVKSDTCLLYAGASHDFTPFYQIPQGTTLEIAARSGEDWLKVQVPAGATAWVSKDFIGPWSEKIQQEQAVKEAAAQAEAEKLAAAQDEAKRLLEANEALRKELEQAKADQEKLLAAQKQAQENPEKLQAVRDQADETAKADPPSPAESPAVPSDDSKPAAEGERQTLVISIAREQPSDNVQPEDTPAPESPSESETSVEMPADADLDAVIPPVPAEAIRGIIISLGRKSTIKATHVLCERQNFTFVPKLYLHSDLIELKDWEQLEVNVSGNKEVIPNWRLPVLEVRSVMRVRD